MTHEQAQSTLETCLPAWGTSDDATKAALLAQMAPLDFDDFERMRKLLTDKTPPAPPSEPTAPDVIEHLSADARADALEAGEAALRAGQVAVLLVAGGQGSRLGYEGPKGAFPIGPLTRRPIFYFHARKIVGLAARYGKPVPFYIMTSATNDAQTKAHFEEHKYFGLDKGDVIFFRQGEWPALDTKGNLILDAPGHIFMNPDGHGGTIAALEKNGCLDDMARRGVTSVFYFQVDNPLVEIADPVFIGLHALKGADVSLKVCAKRDAEEGLGVVALRGGRSAIIEYTELTEEQAQRRTADGELYFKYGSVAIHIFALDFLKAQAGWRDMPLHLARKKIKMLNASGSLVESSGIKFEKFIFDVLPNAQAVVNLAFDRADEFSPVKNKDTDGNDTPATCKRDMQAKWRRWLAQNGVQLQDSLPVEIDPAYTLSPGDLRHGLRLSSCGCETIGL
ncbi:MAG: UDPGP type 1 family protein [Kiritimatiellaeota bacterium]|nr:UDPGP type 1 family protein [Kiritimatiellota bacterium]